MISIIAAIGNNRELGNNNRLPWKRMGADMDFFHSFIQNKIVIMGAQSYFSLPIELEWGVMIVISRTRTESKYNRTKIVPSVEQALQLAQQEAEQIQCQCAKCSQCNDPECACGDPICQCANKQIVVAGGASIYEQFLPKADKMYLTLIHENFPNADRFFPEWKKTEWKQTNRTDHPADQNNPHNYSFVEMTRIKE